MATTRQGQNLVTRYFPGVEDVDLSKDPVTRREIETLAAEKNAKELESRLSTSEHEDLNTEYC